MTLLCAATAARFAVLAVLANYFLLLMTKACSREPIP